MDEIKNPVAGGYWRFYCAFAGNGVPAGVSYRGARVSLAVIPDPKVFLLEQGRDPRFRTTDPRIAGHLPDNTGELCAGICDWTRDCTPATVSIHGGSRTCPCLFGSGERQNRTQKDAMLFIGRLIAIILTVAQKLTEYVSLLAPIIQLGSISQS